MAQSNSFSPRRSIPIRRVVLSDASQLPNDYSTTPGGTLFSTTPGGTRIVYDRSFLLKCRESPLAQSPPANLPDIPGVTTPREEENKENGRKDRQPSESTETVDEPQFAMDV
ncbi:DgyrCDS5557 [Dimorphilus gyrociliatus]|uniref:DgyrCDS5557 n=1 Tax=Dimorphilus gyrociliatus TaxID=2664684 RepID=A0A7I8VK89_9ANNE|nr:DgyrCDS5557 [Dimorphilus gyrociliatus]